MLKGGTALNLFWWDCPRLSVDLDLNYLGVPLEQMRAEKPQVTAALEGIARAGKYHIQYGKPEHSSVKLHLQFNSALLRAFDHVELDINFLMRACLFKPQQRLCKLYRNAPLSFSVLALEEVMAGKITAMLDRAAPRDLYDMFRFASSSESFDEIRLRQAFLLFTATGLPLPVWKYDVSRLSRITEESIERELWPLLAGNDRPSLAEMLAAVSPLVTRLLELSQTERAFAESVQAGEPDTSLLFPKDAALAKLAATHPALLWKVKNVREHLGRDGGK